jgi:hypothetical protein
MLNKATRILQRNSVWLVLFCHCLLFSGVSFEWISSPKLLKAEEEERPSLFIPSYVYHDSAAPIVSPQSTAPQKVTSTSKLGIEKPVMTQARPSLNINHPIDISRSPETEPVHLIGDKKIDRPLLTLLG